ncbi:hypothetical protein JTE90_024017 [Oedothorax gibbosus]|uniref:Beta-galactosidase n=1 Tax=Oedothorax gibbosus TaxID=931172 RepID=A0AAV6VAM3_9ARAC|nr:hypothetical protein JTE90_024017 [Oedothorax gibbosus]
MNWNISLVLAFCLVQTVCSSSFTVDYKNNCFLKDGKPFRYMSGSIHYFRVPPEFWHDRIYKMKMAGLNAIQTYVEWNHHEPEPGVYNFKKNYDLPRFLKIAHDLNMLVILRPGPYIDAERDMVRTMYLKRLKSAYIKYVDKWYSVLLPLIKPFLYVNGGSIITVQVENEYGFFGYDAQYKSHLRDLFRKYLGNDVVLFTTDGIEKVPCGKTDEVLSTVDFGTGVNVTYIFEKLRLTQASGPLVNSEFYTGWLDHWGYPHANVSTDSAVKTLTEMLKANASVNVYLFHGGTSFGFTAGSNLEDGFKPCTTSYDFDAPLNEAGDPTPKYYALKETIGKFFPLPPGPLPVPAPKMKSDPIPMKRAFSFWALMELYKSFSVFSTYPLSFEDLHTPFGFVVYEAKVQFTPTDPAVLIVKGIADRGYVYVNQVLQGILSREQKVESIPINILQNETITIIVENQGRVCFGSGINDRKGIFQNVTLCSKTLVNWTMTPINSLPESMSKLRALKHQSTNDPSLVPAIFYGSFKSKGTILDTFLSLEGWHKGVAFVNGFNLGRYWPIVGPQVTLYVPSCFLRSSSNDIILIEFEKAPCENKNNCVVQFVAVPILNGTTPGSGF